MNRKNLMLAMAGAMIALSDPTSCRDYVTVSIREKPKNREELHDYMFYNRTHDSRQLREFSIKGHKVMAYSRKDAITRLKHMKKK